VGRLWVGGCYSLTTGVFFVYVKPNLLPAVGNGSSCGQHTPRVGRLGSVGLLQCGPLHGVFIELTVPMEDRLTESATIKTAKYKGLVHDIASNNWQCDFFSVEIGCRGNDAASLGRCLSTLGFMKKERQNLQRLVCCTARRSSYFVYLKRNDATWAAPR